MIWCVEDDAGIRDIEVYALESTGFEAKGFEEGESFFAALEKDRPDVQPRQQIEQCRRVARVGAVVEGEQERRGRAQAAGGLHKES